MLNIYPVIHLAPSQVEPSIQQLQIAIRAGADGVFFISHEGKDDEVLQAADLAMSMVPNGFSVGVNLLGHGAVRAFDLARVSKVHMLWVDDPGLSSAGVSPLGAELMERHQQAADLLVFASVAFKYQPVDPYPARAAGVALASGFFPVTSGDATGHAPDLSKVIAMSKETGGRLGLASGMTPDNVARYSPWLSAILVATGVSLDEHRLDPVKLQAFIKNARSVPAEFEPIGG